MQQPALAQPFPGLDRNAKHRTNRRASLTPRLVGKCVRAGDQSLLVLVKAAPDRLVRPAVNLIDPIGWPREIATTTVDGGGAADGLGHAAGGGVERAPLVGRQR